MGQHLYLNKALIVDQKFQTTEEISEEFLVPVVFHLEVSEEQANMIEDLRNMVSGI